MSTQNESAGVIIPQGQALTFQAPPGGMEWKLRNTVDGLMAEAGDAALPVLRLTPRGAVIRGDLGVDGEIRQEFDPYKFVNTWEVIEGDIGHPGREMAHREDPEPYFAIIEAREDGRFELCSRHGRQGAVISRQTLSYNPRTRTLDEDDLARGMVARCISFWDCKTQGGEADRIFAIRRQKLSIPSMAIADCEELLLPWEVARDDQGNPLPASVNGTWGAEEG